MMYQNTYFDFIATIRLILLKLFHHNVLFMIHILLMFSYLLDKIEYFKGFKLNSKSRTRRTRHTLPTNF